MAFALLLMLGVDAAAEDTSNTSSGKDEIDPLALASVLIHDKHFERAKTVLEAVRIDDRSLDINRGTYYLLLGLSYLELGNDSQAAAALEKSVEEGVEEKSVFIFMAQAKFRLSDYKGAIAAIEQAPKEAEALPGMFLIHAQSYWRLGDRHRAFDVLEQAHEKFPKDEFIQKNRVLLLVDLGLFQAAMEEGKAYLASENINADAYVALAEALIFGNQLDAAIVLLETARLKYPEDDDIVIQLAKAYMRDAHLFVAARLFEHASRTSPKLLLDAAELYRRAGQFHGAMRLNSGITDQKSKIRQRLGLLIETERFDEAAALGPRLRRLQLLDEDPVAYGFAYALFMVGRFDASKDVLKRIVDKELFEKAIRLRHIMETCASKGGQCP